MTPFGEKVRQLRKDRGILMKKMASDLGVSSAYLSAAAKRSAAILSSSGALPV